MNLHFTFRQTNVAATNIRFPVWDQFIFQIWCLKHYRDISASSKLPKGLSRSDYSPTMTMGAEAGFDTLAGPHISENITAEVGIILRNQHHIWNLNVI